MSFPLAITAAGMVTGVGLDFPSSCAAIRCGIDNFQETRFIDQGGEWLLGSEVPLEVPYRGMTKLVKMAASAIQECLDATDQAPENILLILCLSEPERPGRFSELDQRPLANVQEELGVQFHPKSAYLKQGRVGGVSALKHAREFLQQPAIKQVIIAGVDTFLVAETLRAFEQRFRLLTSQNSNGFIPGEGAAAVLVEKANDQTELTCMGIGTGIETATIESEEPLKADGLTTAIKAALADSNTIMEDYDYRITDISGEQYLFKESSLATSRTKRNRKNEYDIYDLWHPADCIGEVGAAIVPSVLAVALAATQKHYSLAPGILCHFGNDDGQRGVLLLQSTQEAT